MKKIFQFAALGVFFCALTAFAENSATDKLTQLLSHYQSMTANFMQSVKTKQGTQTSQGEMALQRPGKFRWEIQQPHRQLLIADGKYLWIYDKDLAQVTRQSIDRHSHSPASLLSGDISGLKQRFSIKLGNSKNDSVSFILKPKGQHDVVQSVELFFVNDQLHKMLIEDSFGQKNQFRFTNVVINPMLPKQQFQFKVPRGVDVIKN